MVGEAESKASEGWDKGGGALRARLMEAGTRVGEP